MDPFYVLQYFRGEGAFVIGVLTTLLIGKLLKDSFLKGNYPSGPIGLPILGYLLFLTKDPHLKLQQLSKKYGDIFSIRLGLSDVVVLNSARTIKEVLNRPEVLARPINNPFNSIAQTPFFDNGKVWSEHRRFVMHSLRDLGLGKSVLHERIKDEIDHIVLLIEKAGGGPCNVKKLLTPSMSNNICSLIFGKRYEYDDSERIYLDNILEQVSKYISQTSISVFFPVLLKIPLVSRLFGFNRLKSILESFRKLIGRKVQDHKLCIDNNNPRDLIDSYITELEARKKTDPDTTLSENYLAGTIQNLFGAGSETVRTSIGWALYIMAGYPDIQKKVQKEIDLVLGTERSPSFENMKDMPYVQSVMTEILRWRTVAPISPLRAVLEDVDVYGYRLPKGTIVMANLWAAHHDTRCWENPSEFKPERFLSADGKSFQKLENYIPFSYGKRACPGEGLAISEVFLYFTTLMQKFDISLPEGQIPDFEGELTLSYHLKPHKLCFKARI